MIAQDELAPDFELAADDGSTVRLSELRGRTVVLFFYPRADTPGCTTEACEFRDRSEDFDTQGTLILGISPDPVADVQAFRAKYGLPFRLLADPDHQVAERYGVWKQKTRFGKTYWGVERTTFVIGPDGRVARVFKRVKPAGHAEQVLASL